VILPNLKYLLVILLFFSFLKRKKFGIVIYFFSFLKYQTPITIIVKTTAINIQEVDG